MAKPVVLYNSGKLEGLSGLASGQVLTWNGTDWVPAAGGGGSGGGGVVYYLNENTAAQAPTTGIPTSTDGLVTVKAMERASEVTGTTITSSTLSQINYDAICGFVTKSSPTDPNATSVPAGLWEFNVWADANSTGNPNQTIFRVGVYKYDGSTAPTLINNSDDVYIYDPTTTAQYIASVVIPAGTSLAATDRIYIQIDAKATANNRHVRFFFGDSTPTHVHTTLPSVTGTGIVHVINGVVQTPASAVNLAGGSTEVTGLLPIANGGTGAATFLIADANKVFASPNAAAGAPLYRSLVVADLPTSGIPASSISSIPYDIASMVVGAPAALDVVMRLPAVRAYTISSTNTDHLFRAATAVTGVLTVKNAGSTVFTATFTANTTATISTPVNNTSVVLGSDLTIEVTSTTNLADLYWNIKAVVA
jgi:hypothetical protein